MFSVTVCDHIMVAHSLKGEVFGPAQNMHGATYAVEVEFRSRQLDRDGIVIDIGLAGALLHQVLQPLTYCNLDDVPEFRGLNTTTEFLAREIFERLAGATKAGELGEGAKGVSSICVTLNESHVAWGSYEGTL